MSVFRLTLLTVLAMTAFAANSILNRLALATTTIDAASFTWWRLFAGALFLTLLVLIRSRRLRPGGGWLPALALFVYAAGFSQAYRELAAATGALLLFGAVQATMIGYGLARGERPVRWQTLGLLLAFAGVIWLLLPGAQAPDPQAALLMVVAGVAWGGYSLAGRGSADATRDTAGNFVRSLPFAVLALLLSDADPLQLNDGVLYALLSGALASGGGYALWYAVLPFMRPATAATVQLTVPALTAVAGVFLVGEALTLRLVVASALILGGVALFIRCRPQS